MNTPPRKHWLNFSFIALMGVALLTLSACSKATNSSQETKDIIIGKWEVQGEKSTIEFKTDGTLVGTDAGEPESGKYKFTDATHMQMEIDLTEKGTKSVPGMPPTLVLDCTLKVVDNDNINMDVSMTIPGETKTKKESVHFHRIK